MYRRRSTPKLDKHKARYRARFYDPDTQRRKEVALGTGSKEIAERRFREIVHAYETGDYDPWRDTYRWGTLTAVEAVRLYLEDYQDRNRASSHANISSLLGAWLRSLPRKSGALAGLTPRDVTRYINRPELADATRKGYYLEFSAFFAWCVRENHLKRSPLEGVPVPKLDRELPAFMSRDEYETLVRAMTHNTKRLAPKRRTEYPGYVMAQLVRFLTATGLRIGECVALNWRDVRETERGGVRLFVERRTKTQSSKRSVPLFDAARAVVSELREDQTARYGRAPRPDEPLFVTVTGARLNKRHASTTFKAYVEHTGVNPRLKLHSTRHTFASWLVMAGESLYKVSRLMGHASTRATEVYAHLSPDFTSEIGAGIFSDTERVRR